MGCGAVRGRRGLGAVPLGHLTLVAMSTGGLANSRARRAPIVQFLETAECMRLLFFQDTKDLSVVSRKLKSPLARRLGSPPGLSGRGRRVSAT